MAVVIVLSAGHYPESPGACFPDDNVNWCEHAEASNWVNRIAVTLRDQKAVHVVPHATLRSKVEWINDLCKRVPVKLAVEIHFNSDVGKHQIGSETLYCPGSPRGKTMANIVQDAMARVFPPNRGAKEGWYRQDKTGHGGCVGDVDGDEKVDYFLRATNCPALIVEPEFIYNRTIIESGRDDACRVLADALLEAAL